MLKAPATISKVSSMADSTLRLQVDLQELSAEEEAEIFKLRNKLGWFVFNETSAIRESDIPTEQLEDHQKTPSQRLRSVMFVYWKQLPKTGSTASNDFDTFYRQQTEKYIEFIKRKLDEI